MAIGFPVMSLGVKIPNQAFTIPDPTALGAAAGWTRSSASLIQEALYDGPSPGHQRAQRYRTTAAGTYDVMSNAEEYGKLAANVSTKVTGWAHYKASGLTGGNTATLQAGWHTDAGTLVGSWTTLLSLSDQASWTVGLAEITTTPAASATHVKLRVLIVKGGALNPVVDLAFVGIGCWDAAAGSFTWTRYPRLDLGCFPIIDQADLVGPMGDVTRLDRDLYQARHRLVLPVEVIPDVLQQSLRRAWVFNRGRSWDGSAANPSGGGWRVIIQPKNPGCIGVGIFDSEDRAFPLTPNGNDFLADPPEWNGAMSWIERI